MEEIIAFLRELSDNNNRPWFNAHKERYQAALRQWNEFAMELASQMAMRDPAVAGLGLADITYRIYRDTRFSRNKAPYKTHMGVFLAPGGKKSGHAGYYFHVSGGIGDEYFSGHTLVTGTYCYTTAALQVLREDMSCDWQQFRRDVIGAADPCFGPVSDGELKRVPRGFGDVPAESPLGKWLRMKTPSLAATVTDDFVTQPHLAERLADLFATTTPLCHFLNRGIDFAATEM